MGITSEQAIRELKRRGRRPGSTKDGSAAAIQRARDDGTFGLSTAELEVAVRQRPEPESGRRQKSARPQASSKRKPARRATPERSLLSEPYGWQTEAHDAWRDQGRRGVIEAVTGAGKSMLGLMAAREEIDAGRQVLVLVPTTPLQKQWTENLRRAFPGLRVAQIGGSGTKKVAGSDAAVAVVNSARRGLDIQGPGLLIADEVHRYGSPSNAQALDERFRSRLGLTATYERTDDGIEEHLDPYFGAVCFQLGYRRAIEDGVLAGFRVALLPVELSATEREDYEQLSHEMAKAAFELEEHLGFKEPFEKFMKQVELIAEGTVAGPTWTARRYQKTISARRTLLADTSARTAGFERLVPIISGANRSLVFGERVEQAERFSALLNRHNVASSAIHSEVPLDERDRRLRAFANGKLQAVTAPRVLDEGIDVPEADLGIVAASTRTRRQMIQRMGRVIRKKKDGREARFIILYVEGTTEDPSTGAHDLFLHEVEAAASDLRRFSGGWTEKEVRTFLGGPGARAEVAPSAKGRLTSALQGVAERAKPNTRDRAVAKDLSWDATRVWAMRTQFPAGRVESQRPFASLEVAHLLAVPLDDVQRWFAAEARADHRRAQRTIVPGPRRKKSQGLRPTVPRKPSGRARDSTSPPRVTTCNACGRPISPNGRCGCS